MPIPVDNHARHARSLDHVRFLADRGHARLTLLHTLPQLPSTDLIPKLRHEPDDEHAIQQASEEKCDGASYRIVG